MLINIPNIIISNSIGLLYLKFNMLEGEFIIQNYFIFLGIILLFLIEMFLLIWKSKKKLNTTITKDKKSFSSESKTKNTFLYPEQNLGKLEQGKVCELETFPSYDKKYKVSEFTIIDKDKE